MQIKNKIDSYENFNDFRNDISWAAHNLLIEFPENAAVQHGAKNLLKFIDEEIMSIKLCAQCYTNAFLNPSNSFVMPCDTPHPIIWAKEQGFDFWPAKCMAVSDDHVHVRFFGDHTTGNIPVKYCFKYSKEPPEAPKSDTINTYILALREAEQYVQNLQEHLGYFEYAEKGRQIDPDGLLTELGSPDFSPIQNNRVSVKPPSFLYDNVQLNTDNYSTETIEPERNDGDMNEHAMNVGYSMEIPQEQVSTDWNGPPAKILRTEKKCEELKRSLFIGLDYMKKSIVDNLSHFDALEEQLQVKDNGNKTLQGKVAKLEKDLQTQSQYIIDLQEKIAHLERENAELTNKIGRKTCVECGKVVCSVIFCNNECHEKNIK